MIKLVIRFFILCLVVSVLSWWLLIFFSEKFIAHNTFENAVQLEDGELYLLDQYLAPHPPSEWRAILYKNAPRFGENVDVVPVNQLHISGKQHEQLNNHQWIYQTYADTEEFSMYPNNFYEAAVTMYKISANPHYAYKVWMDFRSIDFAHLLIGWLHQLCSEKILHLSPEKQAVFLKKIGGMIHMPASLHLIKDVHVNPQEMQRLQEGRWLYIKKDNTQIVFAPINNTPWVMEYGPKPMDVARAYDSTFIYGSAFLFLELLVFIAAILFAYSLEKVKSLADAYGRGDFSSRIRLSKTSVLFPLFRNLKLMGERIKSLIASHKDLTNTIAHELRTPLSRLRFSLALLKESKDVTQVEDRTNAMEEDIAELDLLVSEILTYAKIDHTDLTFKLEKISVQQLVEQVLEKIKPELFQKKLSLDVNPSLEKISFNANLNYTSRAIQNLLRNAERHARSEVKLSLTQPDAKHLRITVEDDGPGIPPKDRTRVFEPFVQLTESAPEKPQGYGLGLAITKKIVDQQAWQIEISDSSLGGAKVAITIPL